MDAPNTKLPIRRGFNPSNFKHDSDMPVMDSLTLRDLSFLFAMQGLLANGERGQSMIDTAKEHAELAIKAIGADSR